METIGRGGDLLSRLGTFLIARGVTAVLFGILVLAWPGITLRALVFAFGAYSLVDGAIALLEASAGAGRPDRWRLVVHGMAGVAAGVAVLVWPALTALALLYLIGTWAIVLGATEVVSALAVPGDGGQRLRAGLHGLVGLAFGLIMWIRPGAGALALLALVATLAIVTGVTRIADGVELRRRSGFPAAEVRTSAPAEGARGRPAHT
jgi:uncharacterized membrane protein HdeD (DUF308 family)